MMHTQISHQEESSAWSSPSAPTMPPPPRPGGSAGGGQGGREGGSAARRSSSLLRFSDVEGSLFLGDHGGLVPEGPDLSQLFGYLAGGEFRELSDAVQVQSLGANSG